MKITITVPHAPRLVDLDGLAAELAAAGLPAPVDLMASTDGVSATWDQRVDESTAERIIETHRPQMLVDVSALVDKSRAVWAGSDTFTQAQAQKILAGLVLIVAKHLR